MFPFDSSGPAPAPLGGRSGLPRCARCRALAPCFRLIAPVLRPRRWAGARRNRLAARPRWARPAAPRNGAAAVCAHGLRSISIVVCRAGFVNGPVRAPPRRCRPSVPHPDAPQHCHLRIPSARRSTPALTFHPRAAARPPSHSVHAPPLRERAAPPGWHPRHTHAVAVIRPRRASVYRRGMAQDGTVLPRLSIPARRHGRSTLCFCALSNYHSAVLTNARPPCYAEASAGRGRPAPPRRPAAGNEPGRTLRNPRALPQGTNRGRTLLQPPPPCRGNGPGRGRSATPAPAAPCSPRGAPEGNGPPPCRGKRTGGGPPRNPRRPAAGNEPGRDVPATPAPAAPRSPRGAPEGNGPLPKTNGLRARHRAAGGKEAACSASSCPRCARWRR